MIEKKYKNLGLGTEVIELLGEEAKKLGYTKIVALVDVDNIPSQRIFLKNNYKRKMLWLEKSV